ncbi:MAG: PfkB family carbohydrate kinase [Candidatus Bathyarchaeia archaeon]
MRRRLGKGYSSASIKNLICHTDFVVSLSIFDVSVVGHFSIDSIFLPNKRAPYVVLGGSAAYTSLILKRLGLTVSVVSKVGGDFPNAYLWWLKKEGINLDGVAKVENAETTRFELKYNADLSRRILQLKSKAPPINMEDLPKPLRAKAVHIAPIANETPPEVIDKLRSCAEILSIDPQGLVRNFDSKGHFTYSSLKDKHLLELVNIYKSSSKEIKAVTRLSDISSAIKAIHDYGVEIVIVTFGVKGTLLSAEETKYQIPAYKTEKIVDPTGAGDVFIGGFLAEHVKGKNAFWCACVGSAAASVSVEAIGPTFQHDKTEIYRRANALYEKGIKG